MNSLAHTQMVDPALASGMKYGYNFAISFSLATPQHASNFIVTATPRSYGKTGRISYYINSLGEIRGGDKGGQPVDGTDPVMDDCSSGTIADNERCNFYTIEYVEGSESTFWFEHGRYASLAELVATGRVDAKLLTGVLRGYTYTVVTTPATGQTPATYHLNVTPQIYGSTGTRSFYLDETNVIRGADKQGAPADQNDPPIH